MFWSPVKYLRHKSLNIGVFASIFISRFEIQWPNFHFMIQFCLEPKLQLQHGWSPVRQYLMWVTHNHVFKLWPKVRTFISNRSLLSLFFYIFGIYTIADFCYCCFNGKVLYHWIFNLLAKGNSFWNGSHAISL